MKLFEIKHRFTGAVLFSLETDSFKLCVEAAVKADANLTRAYLEDANLSGANLSGANLADANLTRAYLAGANLADANLSGANLSGANLAGANLADANLADANLSGANFTGANFTGANLADAKIRDGITITQSPVFIYGLTWRVSIFDSHMSIGCEFHSHDEWAAFDDQIIAAMGRDALTFWKANKDVLMTLCRSHAAKVE